MTLVIHSPWTPCHLIRTAQIWLVSVCFSLSHWFSIFVFLPCFLSSFSSPRCDRYRRRVQTVQRVKMILCGTPQCCWHCLTWAGLGMGHTRWHRLWLWMGAQMPAGVSISAGFTNLHSILFPSSFFFYRQQAFIMMHISTYGG